MTFEEVNHFRHFNAIYFIAMKHKHENGSVRINFQCYNE